MGRKYQKVKALLPKIEKMIEKGMTQREIAEKLGLDGKTTVKNLMERDRKKRRERKTLPKQQGRKPAVTLQQYKYENKRLKMENTLLRDFLESMERK